MTPPKVLLSKRYLMISIQVKQNEMYSIVNNIRAKVTHAGSNSSFHDFLASRLPKTKTPNQKHGHVFEAILQLVPETGTPHTTPPPHHWNVEILGSFFSQKLFFGLLFFVTSILFESKTKILHAQKINLELDKWIPKRISFSKEPPPFSDSSRSFFGRLHLQFLILLGTSTHLKMPHPREMNRCLSRHV